MAISRSSKRDTSEYGNHSSSNGGAGEGEIPPGRRGDGGVSRRADDCAPARRIGQRLRVFAEEPALQFSLDNYGGGLARARAALRCGLSPDVAEQPGGPAPQGASGRAGRGPSGGAEPDLALAWGQLV